MKDSITPMERAIYWLFGSISAAFVLGVIFEFMNWGILSSFARDHFVRDRGAITGWMVGEIMLILSSLFIIYKSEGNMGAERAIYLLGSTFFLPYVLGHILDITAAGLLNSDMLKFLIGVIMGLVIEVFIMALIFMRHKVDILEKKIYVSGVLCQILFLYILFYLQ